MFKHRLSTEAKKMDAESKQKLDLEIDDEWTVLGESDFVDELDKASVTAECGEEIGNDEEDDMGFEILGEERDMKHKDNFVVAPLA